MTEDKNTIEVVARFFSALDKLKDDKAIRGLQTFTKRYELNRRNVQFVRANPTSGMFKAGWLALLVQDYGVAPAWLLTGEGDFYATNSGEKCK